MPNAAQDVHAVLAAALDSIGSGRCPQLESHHLQNGTLTLLFHPERRDDKYDGSWQGALEKKIKEYQGIHTVRFLSTHHRPAPGAPGKSCATQDGGKQSPPKLTFPTIKYLIAVGSGKGGVGKSTVTVNLGRSLNRRGMGVGILDADIYGPSLPTLMGLRGRPSLNPQGKLTPLTKDGIAVMSMGFFLETKTPLIWRGPMVSSSLTQLFRDVDWGDLDILLIDLPPGTGDVQLTLAQKIPLNGAIIVSTPQDLALIDAFKGLEMFQTLNVPIVGVVENMSMFHCPHCAHQSPIFNAHTVKTVCHDRGVPYLGAIPIDPAIGTAADAGSGLDPKTPAGLCFEKIAGDLMANFGLRTN